MPDNLSGYKCKKLAIGNRNIGDRAEFYLNLVELKNERHDDFLRI